MGKNRPSLKEKEAATEVGLEGLNYDFNDYFAVDPELKKEIESKGLVSRWINAVKLRANFGYDSRQWTPYKRDSQPTGMSSFSDPEGYVRRGDLILAVQPKQVAAVRKARLEARNRTNNVKSRNKAAAEELRQHMKESGIKADISEGYEDNGE